MSRAAAASRPASGGGAPTQVPAALPNFFLGGPPKTGTTAIADALNRHPQVFLPASKEPCYFLYTDGNPYNLDLSRKYSDLNEYVGLFRGAGGFPVRMDASPYYIYFEQCAEEIYKFNSDSKIMFILRNPVERAYSMYRYWYQNEKSVEMSPADFRRKFIAGEVMFDFNRPGESHYRTIEWLRDMGYYAAMLKRYYAVFPKDQILITCYDDLVIDSRKFMARVLEFLQVDGDIVPEIREVNVTLRLRSRPLHYWLNFDVDNPVRRFVTSTFRSQGFAGWARSAINRINRRAIRPNAAALPAEIYNELIQFYADDLRELTGLVGIDFSGWLEPRT